MHRQEGDCCGPSAEAILQAAVETDVGLQRATAPFKPAIESMRCGMGGVGSGAILRNINSAPNVPSARACRSTCHRAMRHVCDTALHRAYAADGHMRFTAWAELELHERAGLALRRLFGGNASACREALRYYGEPADDAPVVRSGMGVPSATNARRSERCIGSWCSEG